MHASFQVLYSYAPTPTIPKVNNTKKTIIEIYNETVSS
jgi:hypothetical protein